MSKTMNTGQLTAENKAIGLAQQVAEYRLVEVVSVNFLGRGRRKLLRIAIDKEGGVTLGDCEGFSRELERLLDSDESFQGPYDLEVSSPGLDRPLTTIKDFERCIGKLARVITKEKIDNQSFFLGRIMKVENNIISLLLGKKERDIPFEEISKAKLEIEIK